MPYNMMSLIDRDGSERTFDMMTITLREHLEDPIQCGCELCEKYGSDGFQIHYGMAGYGDTVDGDGICDVMKAINNAGGADND